MNISGLDHIDNQIAALLQKDARLSMSDLAREVGISRVAVRNRVEQMEQQGIIRGYHARIDPQALPKGIRFTLDIEAAPADYEEVIAGLCASSMLHGVYGTSGKNHIHVTGIAPNSETLGTYAGYLYRSMKGIRELNWQILVTTYKDTERGIDYEQHPFDEHLEGGGREPKPERFSEQKH